MRARTAAGVPGVDAVDWGTHFCQFYESRDDLVDVLVPYFKAGLDNNEFCLWVTSEPFDSRDARRALEAVLPDLSERERRGQIEILDHDTWYDRLDGGTPADVLDQWVQRHDAALANGYEGLRLTGNTYWLEREDWHSFVEYESAVNDTFHKHRIVGLCSYCFSRCSAQDVMDVIRNHQFTVSRRQGDWEIVESSALKIARDELMRLQQAFANEKMIAQRFRDLQIQHKTLIESIPQMVWTSGPGGTVDYANRRWCDYTGLSVEETGAGKWKLALHPEDRERVVRGWTHSVETGRPYELEGRLRDARSGTYRWFLIRALPIRDGDGVVLRWFGTCTDIMVQKEAEEALRRNDRRKDEFLAMLGHELRNPLAPISTALQLVHMSGGSDVFGRELEVIDRQVNHLTGLVDDLLEVSKIARGKIQLQKTGMELHDAVSRGLEMASPLIERRKHSVTVDVSRTGLVVDGDSRRLAQVVSNLLTNAAKYSEPGGDVLVSAERIEDEIVLVVEDHGAGIEPELLPEIFEIFVQGRQTIERAGGGLGLGLPIVRSIVELHGGSVEVESTLGEGSRFTVRLPASEQSVTEATTSFTQDQLMSPDESAALRVMVVDDNMDAAELLVELLQLMGCQAAMAADGPSALELAETFVPDLALLDIGLPVMDGYELGGRLRDLPGLEDLRIVAVTGYGQQTDRERTEAAGFDRHLVKPINIDILREVIQAMTNKAAT